MAGSPQHETPDSGGPRLRRGDTHDVRLEEGFLRQPERSGAAVKPPSPGSVLRRVRGNGHKHTQVGWAWLGVLMILLRSTAAKRLLSAHRSPNLAHSKAQIVTPSVAANASPAPVSNILTSGDTS